MKSLLREPLFHFLILGTLLFAIWYVREEGQQQSPVDSSKPQIVITESRIDSLIDIWTKTRQRPPTPDELRGLIDDFLREEIFYREAVAMGLDENDTIVRRRMRQKLELFVEDFATAASPTTVQLQGFLASHPDRFRVDRKLTIRHIYFKPDRHPEGLDQEIAELHQSLDASSDPTRYGDPFLLPSEFNSIALTELDQLFGNNFGQRLFDFETDQWLGPIESAYGQHLVYLDEKIEGRLPALEEIRPSVEREWFARAREDAKQEFYEKLRDRYEIVIESSSDQTAVEDSSS